MEKKENKRMLMDRPAGEVAPTPAGGARDGAFRPLSQNCPSKRTRIAHRAPNEIQQGND
jgi:hypothetical protein